MSTPSLVFPISSLPAAPPPPDFGDFRRLWPARSTVHLPLAPLFPPLRLDSPLPATSARLQRLPVARVSVTARLQWILSIAYRLATFTIAAQVLEAGGSIIHMRRFADLLGLTANTGGNDDTDWLGIWDGARFVFKTHLARRRRPFPPPRACALSAQRIVPQDAARTAARWGADEGGGTCSYSSATAPFMPWRGGFQRFRPADAEDSAPASRTRPQGGWH